MGLLQLKVQLSTTLGNPTCFSQACPHTQRKKWTEKQVFVGWLHAVAIKTEERFCVSSINNADENTFRKPWRLQITTAIFNKETNGSQSEQGCCALTGLQ